MKNQKIIALALGLLIVAGIIVIGLKGFNVDFMLKQHDSIEYSIKDEFEINDVKDICSEVFGDKKFKIRVIELFNDAVSINAETITTEEAENIIKKLDEKYASKPEETPEVTETTSEETTDYNIISNPKIKLFSLFKPYILPIILSALGIIVYVGIRFRNQNSMNVILKLIGMIVLTVLSLISLIAITRFPVNTYVIPAIMIVVLLELAIFCAKLEKEDK